MTEKPKKDIIYIDIEDDITDVVNKVSSSEHKIIALVPPKGVGVLNSAVNLRLLERTIKKQGKQIVLVTGNSALANMSAAAKIPVAKTLQSKPEIPEIDALEVDGEDLIDGEKLPVSEFMNNLQDNKEDQVLDGLDIDDNKNFSKKVNVDKKKGSGKVPNFNEFRKKLFLIGAGVILLIGFLVWAIIFAPFATIYISAKTSSMDIANVVSLTTDSNSVDINKNLLLAKTETLSKESEVEFEATGSKEVGSSAQGIMTVSQKSTSRSVSVPSGTTFSSGDCVFVSTANAVIPGAEFDDGQAITQPAVKVPVKARSIGEQCNLSARVYSASIPKIAASGSVMSGGMKKTIKIITEDDAKNALAKLSENKNEGVKSELVSKFGSKYNVINESFSTENKDPEFSPKVGDESENGKAKVKVQSIYKMIAIDNENLKQYLDNSFKKKIGDSKNQKIYDDGSKNVTFTNYESGNGIISLKINASGRVGPDINHDEIKSQIKGKVYGDVQKTIESIEGVNKVDVKFSYFWVTTVPNDANKVKVETVIAQ